MNKKLFGRAAKKAAKELKLTLSADDNALCLGMLTAAGAVAVSVVHGIADMGVCALEGFNDRAEIRQEQKAYGAAKKRPAAPSDDAQ